MERVEVLGLWDDVRRENLRKAVVMFLRRRLGVLFPVGEYRGSLWFGDRDELLSCCSRVRATRSEPMRLYNHCCGVDHIGRMYGVRGDEISEAVEDCNLPMLLGIDPDIDEWIAKRLKVYVGGKDVC